jgi:hypothetical protein
MVLTSEPAPLACRCGSLPCHSLPQFALPFLCPVQPSYCWCSAEYCVGKFFTVLEIQKENSLYKSEHGANPDLRVIDPIQLRKKQDTNF